MTDSTSLLAGDASSGSPQNAILKAGASAPMLVSVLENLARSRLLTVSANTRLVEVAARLSCEQITVVVVCDEAGTAMGTITEALLLRHLGLGRADFFATRAGDVTLQEVTTCTRCEKLSDVLAMMHARGIIDVLVVDTDRQPLGVLNARDGLRALLATGSHFSISRPAHPVCAAHINQAPVSEQIVWRLSQ